MLKHDEPLGSSHSEHVPVLAGKTHVFPLQPDVPSLRRPPPPESERCCRPLRSAAEWTPGSPWFRNKR